MPLMIAAARIAKEPAKYGFEHVIPMEAVAYDEVEAGGHTDLATIAAAAGVSAKEIASLNPFLKGDRAPKSGYLVRVPRGVGMRVASALGAAEATLTETATKAAQ